MTSEDINNRCKNIRVNNSFIIRNRALSDNQKKLYRDTYQKWGLDVKKTWDFTAIFNNSHDVILEIGFGCGDTLIKNARFNPHYNYIGIEVYQAGVLHVLASISQLNKYNTSDDCNIRVCHSDVKLIIANCLQNKVLAGVQIFFPDPWPKRKHHKRRLIQDDFITEIAKKIRSDGFLHLATDWADYAEQMLQVLNNNKHYSNMAQSNDYYKATDRLLTKFEQRGLNMGHQIFDVKFKVI